MNHTMLNAGSVMNRCARFIVLSGSRLRVLASTLRISKLDTPSEQDFYRCTRWLGVHFSARSPEGFRASLKGVACSVAVVIGISLSIAEASSSEASIDATKSIKVLADKQLTDKQYDCHNQIIYRESRWNINAVNGSHHGLYQGRSKSLKNSSPDYQFWWYWYYVTNRYGITQYDEPNYCAALHHLKTRGWQ